MDKLILAAIVFVLCFIVRLVLYVISKKKKKKKNQNGIATEMKYLIAKFNLDKGKVDRVSIASIISLLDAIIISATLTLVISVTDIIILELLIGLVVVIILIYIVFEIMGKILVKRGYGK